MLEKLNSCLGSELFVGAFLWGMHMVWVHEGGNIAILC